MRALSVIALLALAASANAASHSAVTYRYFRLPLPLVTEDTVKRTGFIRDHLHDDEYAFGYVREGTALPEAWQRSVAELDAWDVARGRVDLKTLRAIAEPVVDSIGPVEPYHTYATLTAELEELAGNFPQILKLESAGKSVQGRDLWYVRMTSPTGNPGKPQLLYVSSMHGDEVTGKEMMVYLIRELANGYGRDPRVSALLDGAELFIMPSMNPDGTEKHQRWNANGVDLNRDFPDVSEEPFGGNRAVETRALMELFRKHRFLIDMNFHGGSLVINIPWDHKANPAGSKDLFGDNGLVLSLAQEYARLNPPMHQSSGGSFDHGVTYGYEWYQILGGMQDWSIWFQQSTHATAELSDVKWPNASQLPKFWNDNREALLTWLERGIEGMHLKVVDAAGKPLAAKVDVSSANRPLDFADGVVHRPTIPGPQKVRISSPGFRTVELPLEPWKFQGDYKTVTLTP